MLMLKVLGATTQYLVIQAPGTGC